MNTFQKDEIKKTEQNNLSQGNDNLSNDNVNVKIRPDVKDNIIKIQICSCAFIFHLFRRKDEEEKE